MDFDIRKPDATGLSETAFSSALQRISSERLLVLIDACHAGGVASFKASEQGEVRLGYSEKSLARLAEGTGRVLIASCRATEFSLVLGNARNSVFTSKLLEALRGEGPTSGDGVIRVFDVFNHVAEMVRRAVPGRQHPIFKASDLEDNFPVTLDGGGAKTILADTTSSIMPGTWEQLNRLMPDLYPLGPMDQEVWARAGGDPSRLHLSGTGRALWFKALRTAPSRWRWGRHFQGQSSQSCARRLSPSCGVDSAEVDPCWPYIVPLRSTVRSLTNINLRRLTHHYRQPSPPSAPLVVPRAAI